MNNLESIEHENEPDEPIEKPIKPKRVMSESQKKATSLNLAKGREKLALKKAEQKAETLQVMEQTIIKKKEREQKAKENKVKKIEKLLPKEIDNDDDSDSDSSVEIIVKKPKKKKQIILEVDSDTEETDDEPEEKPVRKFVSHQRKGSITVSNPIKNDIKIDKQDYRKYFL